MTDTMEFGNAQRLLDVGMVKCRALCKRQLPVDDVITLYYQRTLIIAVCQECFGKVDLITSMTSEGLSFKIKPRSALISLG